MLLTSPALPCREDLGASFNVASSNPAKPGEGVWRWYDTNGNENHLTQVWVQSLPISLLRLVESMNVPKYQTPWIPTPRFPYGHADIDSGLRFI